MTNPEESRKYLTQQPGDANFAHEIHMGLINEYNTNWLIPGYAMPSYYPESIREIMRKAGVTSKPAKPSEITAQPET